MIEQKKTLDGLLRLHAVAGYEQLGLLLEAQGPRLALEAPMQGLEREGEGLESCRHILSMPTVALPNDQNHGNHYSHPVRQQQSHNPSKKRTNGTKEEESMKMNERLLHCLIALRSVREKELEKEKTKTRNMEEGAKEEGKITYDQRSMHKKKQSGHSIYRDSLRSLHMGYLCPYTDIYASCGYELGSMGAPEYDSIDGGTTGIRIIDRNCLCNGKLLFNDGYDNEASDMDKGGSSGGDRNDGGVCRVVSLPMEVF